jgi:hypothetical protein
MVTGRSSPVATGVVSGNRGVGKAELTVAPGVSCNTGVGVDVEAGLVGVEGEMRS